jgi:transposase
MPARREPMRRIREVLRLLWECQLSQRQVATCCGLGRTAVADYVRRAERGQLDRASLVSLSDEELERRLFPPPPQRSALERPLADWSEVHHELRKKGVTLELLWQEYRQQQPTGYSYSRYCELYRHWRKRSDVTMRQVHRAGEKMFVDYSGHTVPVHDPRTGSSEAAEIFVAVWGASNFTYAEATATQQIPDWIGAHVNALEFSGVVPSILVSDNLRSGVNRPCRYEPEINPSYRDFANHYGLAVIPARVQKSRDKAKVEVGVQIVGRWILARLRKRTFFSLTELNAAIRELLVVLNERPFRKLPGNRRSLFESLDRPAARPLPTQRYIYAAWKKARVNIDYHVEVEAHYYSVPYQLVGQQLDVRLSAHTIECFHLSKRVASHVRSLLRGGHTTLTDHMPRPHRDYAEWTPERLVRWASDSGPAVADLVAAILAKHIHPQQGFRSCLGILRLGKRYGVERLAAACQRALAARAHSYRSVESILKNGLDRQSPDPEPVAVSTIPHENLRGAAYYHEEDESC